jgi:tight adherence protein C
VTAEIIIISLLVLFSALVIAWQAIKTARHVTYVTLADGRRQERRLPLLIRLSLPFAAGVPRFITGHPALNDSRQRISRKLVSGGYEDLIQPQEIFALRILVPLGAGGLFCLLFGLAVPQMTGAVGEMLARRQFTVYFLVILLFGVYTDLWLRRSVRIRHSSIQRALPFVLDLLTLSVESGLDFMTGINRILQKREIDPLGEELIRVFREIQVGRSRKEALLNFSARVNHADISMLSNALIQADELGSGIGTALRIQADQIRTKRFQRAEKLGNEAPVKMLFPLIAFIFPAVFLILLGPVLLQMIQHGGLF